MFYPISINISKEEKKEEEEEIYIFYKKNKKVIKTKTPKIECVYVVKTYEFNHKEKTIDYAGLWEDENGNKEFKTEDEARLQFEYASEGDKGYVAVELVKIDPNSEDRETCIAEWEDEIDDEEEEFKPNGEEEEEEIYILYKKSKKVDDEITELWNIMSGKYETKPRLPDGTEVEQDGKIYVVEHPFLVEKELYYKK